MFLLMEGIDRKLDRDIKEVDVRMFCGAFGCGAMRSAHLRVGKPSDFLYYMIRTM